MKKIISILLVIALSVSVITYGNGTNGNELAGNEDIRITVG